MRRTTSDFTIKSTSSRRKSTPRKTRRTMRPVLQVLLELVLAKTVKLLLLVRPMQRVLVRTVKLLLLRRVAKAKVPAVRTTTRPRWTSSRVWMTRKMP